MQTLKKNAEDFATFITIFITTLFSITGLAVTILYGLFSLATSHAKQLTLLSILCFLAGIGIAMFSFITSLNISTD